MHRIIYWLKNINFWTIVGTLITIATVIVTVYERRPHRVDLIVNAEEPFEIRPGEETNVLAVLYGVDEVDSDSIKVMLPLSFRNHENKSINLDYSIIPPENFEVREPLDFGTKMLTPISIVVEGDKLLHQAKTYAKFNYLTTRESINMEHGDSVSFSVGWIYEKMNNNGRAKVNLFCVRGNNKAQYDYIVSKINENPKLWIAVKFTPNRDKENLFVVRTEGFRFK